MWRTTPLLLQLCSAPRRQARHVTYVFSLVKMQFYPRPSVLCCLFLWILNFLYWFLTETKQLMTRIRSCFIVGTWLSRCCHFLKVDTKVNICPNTEVLPLALGRQNKGARWWDLIWDLLPEQRGCGVGRCIRTECKCWVPLSVSCFGQCYRTMRRRVTYEESHKAVIICTGETKEIHPS